MTDLARHLRALSQRTPAEHAFYAFVALSEADKLAMVAMFNALHAGRPHPERLAFTPAGEATS